MSDKKLSSIKPDLKPNEQVVKVLEHLLEEAKKGDLRSLVAVSEYNNDDLGNSYILEKGCHPYSILGALFVLQNLLISGENLMDRCIE